MKSNIRSFCEFKDAILEHVRDHVPSRTIEFVPVADERGNSLFGTTVDGVLVDSATANYAEGFRRAVQMSMARGAPGLDVVHVAAEQFAHHTVDRIFHTYPFLQSEVQEYNDDLDNQYADLSDGMASAMFDALNANRRKGATWDTDNVHGLLAHLSEEVNELAELAGTYADLYGDPIDVLLDERVRDRIQREAADVANMAAMVASRFGALPVPAPEEAENLDFAGPIDVDFDAYSRTEQYLSGFRSTGF